MDSIFATTVALLAILVICLYKYLKQAYSFWERRGVPYLKPNWLFGNVKDVFLMRTPMAKFHKDLYEQLSPHKYGGCYNFQKPIFILRDPELIKNILIKDFDHFTDRGFPIDSELEPLSRHLFFLNGSEWKNLRIKLTPTFTTGRMKAMFPLIEECGKNLDLAIDKMIIKNEDIEIKDLISRYTTDVIGSCAFGLETGSLEDPDSEFRKMGRRVFAPRFRTVFRLFVPNMPKFIIQLFGLTFIDQELSNYFLSLVKRVVEYRKNNNIRRNDFLDLLIALRNNSNSNKLKNEKDEVAEDLQSHDENEDKKIRVDMTTELMAAQCFLFFGAGFETSAGVTSFALFEIALNSDVQSKLREEIENVLNKHDQQLSYDALKEMKYLDMVLAECLRKYPAATTLFRMCVKDYKISDTDIIIPKGVSIVIPIFGLQRDEQYFPNPDQFRPENFTEESKAKRPPYSYLPFGEGPRVCIAERFAKMQVKTAIVHIIRSYELHLSPKMKLPIELDFKTGLLAVKDGIWLQISKRM